MQDGTSPVPNQDGVLDNGETVWCPDCGSSDLDETIPEVDALCTDCGLVIEDLTDIQIPVDEEERNQKEVDPVNWSEYYTVTNSTEQQVADALERLETIGERLNLDSGVRQCAASLYAEAALSNLTDGRPTSTMVAGVVALSTRKFGTPVPAVRIAAVADVDVQALNHIIRLLSSSLDQTPALCLPEAYLPYLCRELGLKTEIETQARRLLEPVQEANLLVGTNPGGTAGAALYLAAEGLVTQQQIAIVAGVSGETIRVRLRDYQRAVEDL